MTQDFTQTLGATPTPTKVKQLLCFPFRGIHATTNLPGPRRLSAALRSDGCGRRRRKHDAGRRRAPRHPRALLPLQRPLLPRLPRRLCLLLVLLLRGSSLMIKINKVKLQHFENLEDVLIIRSYTGYCHCYSNGGGCEIHLSKPLLETCSSTELKNVLLHEMIHAYLWIEQNNRDRSDHGVSFQAMMNSINSSSAIDPQRPKEGYNVTVDHDLLKDQHHKRIRQSICKMCGKVIISSMNKGPSASDSTENLGPVECCDNPSCHWQSHKKLCSDAQEAECNASKSSSKAKISKRPRTSTSKEDFCSPLKRRKPANSDKECTVVLLGLFEDEETDDDTTVPLVNKRSERRKKQKLLHSPMNQNAQSEASDADTQQNLSPIVMDISDG